ncbi:MAG TPA: hypothetical protein VFT50_11870 [Baekduia sp.]|nr:hypothetical protein [Baekduia sp.]
MKPTVLLVLVLPLLVTFALGACGGQSKQEKATSQVCDARDSIAKQVDTLKGLTLSTATTDQVRTSLTTIRDDLQQIASAQGNLNDQRKAQVQQANTAFKSQLKDITSTLGSSTSLQQAKSKLQTALQQLAASYQKTFAKVDCSGS